MLKTTFISLISLLCISSVVSAQVNSVTIESIDASFNDSTTTTQQFLGTIGRNPNPHFSPLPTPWWSVINIRHRNGGGSDGKIWGTQIATGLTHHYDRMFFRGHVHGSWTSWNEIFTTATPRVLIKNPVDDGTTALQVNGDTKAVGFVAAQISGEHGNRLYSLHDPQNRTRFAIGYQKVENGNNTGSDFAIYSYNDLGHYMTVPFVIERSTGNVGINTANPKAKLAVNGTVMATKVKVSQNAADWPDYVFSAGYQLPPLASVESYIRQHQHLPEIPSAAEVAAEGQDLGDMNKKLLKKVEELTLYLIEQQKQLETQQKAQLQQQQEITRLRDLIEKGK